MIDRKPNRFPNGVVLESGAFLYSMDAPDSENAIAQIWCICISRHIVTAST